MVVSSYERVGIDDTNLLFIGVGQCSTSTITPVLDENSEESVAARNLRETHEESR